MLEETHKHLWTEEEQYANVYVPDDIEAEKWEPNKAWLEFCAEARIIHNGTLPPPPPDP